MNIHEAAVSGKPFRNPDMIGAWMIVNGAMVHRDNPDDFNDMDFIIKKCIPVNGSELYWLNVDDLTRNDWEVVELLVS